LTTRLKRTTQSKEFGRALPVLFKFEGGYANHPSDPGGETKYGISKRAYPDLDIANLTPQDAAEVYWRDYWLPSKAGDRTWPFSLYIFDSAVNHGLKRTRRLLVASGEDAAKFLDCREVLYHDIVRKRPHSMTFLKGWLRRLQHLRQFHPVVPAGASIAA
jgi:hypothetical protein